MIAITPCRASISDRFPVASFVVTVPNDRCFEIVCATDPLLFYPEYAERRTESNFATSRVGGLMRAPAGQATYLMPPEQLRRFAGAKRVYYALGTFRGQREEEPLLSIASGAPERIPWLQLAPDFTGKRLDRSRLRGAVVEARYGAAAPVLTWGGDRAFGGAQRLGSAASPSAAAKPQAAPAVYDDGYDPSLWERQAPAARAHGIAPKAAADEIKRAPSRPQAQPKVPPRSNERFAGAGEPRGAEDAPALRRSGGAPSARYGSPAARSTPTRFGGGGLPEPKGFEDGPALSRARGYGNPARSGQRWGNPERGTTAEPRGFEDAPAARSRSGARFGAVSARSFSEGEGALPAAGPALAPVPAPAPALPSLPATAVRHGDYRVEIAGGELTEPPPRASSGDRPVLSVGDRLRILEVVSAAEGGQLAYGAVNADGEYNDPELPQYQTLHVGLSFGYLQAPQRYGALGDLLSRFSARDPEAFSAAFGADGEALLAVTNAPTELERLAPVGGSLLWEEPWLTRFVAAGRVQSCAEAQREAADQRFAAPLLRAAAWLGMDTDRALAMLLDRAVQMGPGAGLAWTVDAVTPVYDDASLAATLSALGFSDLATFQASIPGLVSDGQPNTLTRVALLGKLRALGAAAPVTVPTLDQMLDAMVAKAQALSGEGKLARLALERLTRLRREPASTSGLTDTAYEILARQGARRTAGPRTAKANHRAPLTAATR